MKYLIFSILPKFINKQNYLNKNKDELKELIVFSAEKLILKKNAEINRNPTGAYNRAMYYSRYELKPWTFKLIYDWSFDEQMKLDKKLRLDKLGINENDFNENDSTPEEESWIGVIIFIILVIISYFWYTE